MGSEINRVKNYFFDRPLVIAQVDKAKRKVLNRQGGYVRKTARHLIKKRKGPSTPGRPPHSHVGTLKRLLYYSYDPASRSVVIGPEAVGMFNLFPVPEKLEYGGKTDKRKNPRRIKRKIGDSGIIRLSDEGNACRTTKWVIDQNGIPQGATFAKLTTERMVKRAERLEEVIYGPMQMESKPIQPRPYMQPAFEASRVKLAEFWKDSVR